MWTRLICFKMGSSAGSCEHGEPPGSIEFEKIVQLSDYQLLKNCLRFEAFTETECREVFSGDQPGNKVSNVSSLHRSGLICHSSRQLLMMVAETGPETFETNFILIRLIAREDFIASQGGLCPMMSTKFSVPSSNGFSVTTVRLEAKCQFLAAVVLFYMLQRNCLSKNCVFFEDTLPHNFMTVSFSPHKFGQPSCYY